MKQNVQNGTISELHTDDKKPSELHTDDKEPLWYS